MALGDINIVCLQGLVYILCLFTQGCSGITSVELQFTSHNCDEEPRRLTESKYYILSWNGQITPHLCSFSFTGGNQNQHGMTKRSYRYRSRSRSYRPRKHYEVCFESVVYNLPYTMGNVKLSIANYTRSEWEFDRYDDIRYTCVRNAYKLNVSIQLPKGYLTPNITDYIKLKITAKLMKEPDIGVISKIIAGAIIGTIGCIVAITLLCKKTNCYIPSCRRLCCCKDTLYQKESTIQDLSSNGRDEPIEMSDRYEHTAVYPTGFGALKPPTSYNSIQAIEMTKQPTIPPPSYEERLTKRTDKTHLPV